VERSDHRDHQPERHGNAELVVAEHAPERSAVGVEEPAADLPRRRCPSTHDGHWFPPFLHTVRMRVLYRCVQQRSSRHVAGRGRSSRGRRSAR
jgi:hypothetical protein